MAKFRCNATGNVFEFTTDHDIKTMREHSEYTEVKEVPKTKEEISIPSFTKSKAKSKQ